MYNNKIENKTTSNISESIKCKLKQLTINLLTIYLQTLNKRNKLKTKEYPVNDRKYNWQTDVSSIRLYAIPVTSSSYLWLESWSWNSTSTSEKLPWNIEIPAFTFHLLQIALKTGRAAVQLVRTANSPRQWAAAVGSAWILTTGTAIWTLLLSTWTIYVTCYHVSWRWCGPW